MSSWPRSHGSWMYFYICNCNMKTFFTFDVFMVWDCIPHADEILYTLNLSCSFITLREPCNNQRPSCDIACLHVYKSFIPQFSELNCYTISDFTAVSLLITLY